MQLKYLKSVLAAQDCENRIAALAWSPNNLKLAVGTSDRSILLFDEIGDRKDKFSTKPAEASNGKRSYVIKSLAFSPDSTKLAVGQTDNIVFVYKIGENWGDKKAICNKFPQSCSVTSVTWLLSGHLLCGLVDGKVRTLNVKTNKSQTLYSSESYVVAMAPNSKGTGILSGHADGTVVRFYLSEDRSEQQGRVLVHNVAPYSLAWPQGQILVGGCDKRICIYDAHGKIMKQFDYSKDDTEREFTVACCSPSGQAVAVGSFDRVRIFDWSPRKNSWEEGPSREIPNLYSVTALAWKRDGSRVVLGSLCGAVEMFESVLRRTLWKDTYELTYVGPSQVLIKSQQKDDSEAIVVRSQMGREIDDVRIMGKDNYLVARTEDTLLVGDLTRNLISEVPWINTNHQERFYFDYPTVCLIFNAGELSLVEYGDNKIIASVRTEFVNPHLISVRLNERNQLIENKKLAYLLDLKTICVLDLITQLVIGQISHDSKIDWLELSETAHKLLFRDKKQRLMLIDTGTGHKETILSNVGFVQWVPGSDVAVAQSGTNLAVWYNIDLPEHLTLIPIRGEVFEVTRESGKTEAFAQDGPSTLTYPLDEGLVEFGTAVHDNDFGRAILFLEGLGDKPEAEAMWYNLANIALSMNNLKVAERSYAALGDASKSFYLQETIIIADKFEKENNIDGMQCPEVWARLAMLNGDLKTAEGIYLEQGDIQSAINMYLKLRRWDDAIKLAERRNYPNVDELKQNYVSFLHESGQEEKAGELYESQGDLDRALNLYIKAKRPARAARLVMNNPHMHFEEHVLTQIISGLVQNEMYEIAGDMTEKSKKHMKAIDYYAKGGVFAKALELARIVSPDLVILLEDQWGDWLVTRRQLDAAISHFIEAGSTIKALDAAVGARQWKKAIQIAQVVDNIDAIKKHSIVLSEQLVEMQEYEKAQELLVRVGLYKEAVELLNKAGQWERGHDLAASYLDASEVSEMYIKQAEHLEELGKFREAENLLIAIDEPDLAIAMYKKVEQFDNMIRLVERYHKELVGNTHLHLARQLESTNKLRKAEIHYLAGGEWKGAVNMYRAANRWDDAHRVAKQHGGELAANQVAFLWARSLPLDSSVRLLNKLNLLEQCITYSCDSGQFQFALDLCRIGNKPAAEVHLKLAMALEDEGKFGEAEEEFILADKPKEAILMYTHNSDWANALRVAETKSPSVVVEVLIAQASEAFTEKHYEEYEALMVRAQQPEMIIKQYRDAGMWQDAMRICKEYLPGVLPSLQNEYERSGGTKNHTVDSRALLSQASEFARNGEFRKAVNSLMQLSSANTDEGTEEAAILRAAEICNQFLQGSDSLEVAVQLGPRLLGLEQYGPAAQLFLTADMPKEAVDCFISAEDWARARRLARELDPSLNLLSYVEKRQKDRLKTVGNVEQLADIDIIGALDLLSEQGQWVRCIDKAKQHSPEILHKYVALYAAELLRDGSCHMALSLYTMHGVPNLQQNYNLYIRIAMEVFALQESEGIKLWAELRQMLYELTETMRLSGETHSDNFHRFETLLLIAHYYCTRAACRQVQALNGIASKISIALLRHTDVIPADKGYYEAGMDLRAIGRESEAFVLLNHYLDLCESIEEGEGLLVDHSDLTATDWPSSIPLPKELHLKNETAQHDEVREWVLAVSMDQKVDQALPLDSRQLYESTLGSSDSPCLITGYPMSGKQPVTFQRSSNMANRDTWSKITVAAKMSPTSNVPDIIKFIEKWCGPANYLIN